MVFLHVSQSSGWVDWSVYEPELPAPGSHQCIPQLVLHTSVETFLLPQTERESRMWGYLQCDACTLLLSVGYCFRLQSCTIFALMLKQQNPMILNRKLRCSYLHLPTHNELSTNQRRVNCRLLPQWACRVTLARQPVHGRPCWCAQRPITTWERFDPPNYKAFPLASSCWYNPGKTWSRILSLYQALQGLSSLEMWLLLRLSQGCWYFSDSACVSTLVCVHILKKQLLKSSLMWMQCSQYRPLIADFSSNHMNDF